MYTIPFAVVVGIVQSISIYTKGCEYNHRNDPATDFYQNCLREDPVKRDITMRFPGRLY
jgi:hypothetical protein